MIAFVLLLSGSSALPVVDPVFLENWMGSLLPVISNRSVLDISLPGTHDSMTSDLSYIVSDGANDLPPSIAWVLHTFGPIIGVKQIGEFIKDQAQTQGLSMKEQLEAGMRFIDFRIMYTAAPKSVGTHDWYCLHMVETNNKAVSYLQQAKDFLDTHKNEVLVMWLSRHGNGCAAGNDQYPNVASADKQKLWSEIKTLFGPLLFNKEQHLLNETTVGEMVSSGQRLVLYVADHDEFTNNDTTVYEGCNHLSNDLKGGDLTNINKTIQDWDGAFLTAPGVQRQHMANDQLNLVSFAGSPPGDQQTDAAMLKFDPLVNKKKTTEKCAKIFNIPNMTEWCPATLLDCEQLRDYYLQISMDRVISSESAVYGAGFPGAFYLDAVGHNGTLRTGTRLLSKDSSSNGDTETAGYAYADTVVLYNVQKACREQPALPSSTCQALEAQLQARRALNPVQRWDDGQGRRAKWPQ
jgi:hypothetical protein